MIFMNTLFLIYEKITTSFWDYIIFFITIILLLSVAHAFIQAFVKEIIKIICYIRAPLNNAKTENIIENKD